MNDGYTFIASFSMKNFDTLQKLQEEMKKYAVQVSQVSTMKLHDTISQGVMIRRRRIEKLYGHLQLILDEEEEMTTEKMHALLSRRGFSPSRKTLQRDLAFLILQKKVCVKNVRVRGNHNVYSWRIIRGR